MTRRHAKSFFFASHALPRAKREAAYAVYSFCRYADDLLDETLPDDAMKLGWRPGIGQDFWLEALNGLLDRLYDGQETELLFGPAFHATVMQYQIPREPFSELIQGVCLDHEPVQIQTWEELRHYCYHVASVVGLIMCPILGLKRPEAEVHAIELGIAMQLTNILRDVREDFGRNRIYLPADELSRFGVTPMDLAKGRVSPEWVAFLRYQIARAREYYDRSEQGIPDLATDGSQLTVWLMRLIYAGILDEIEGQGFDVFKKRATVSFLRKLWLAGSAWRACQV